MAQKRMFDKSITTSDAYLDMPTSTQNLYFHLSMEGDDDGFINSPKRIMRIIGSSQDDLNILFAKKFVIPFESGVVVIKHWRIHNYIRSDRYNETLYKDEKSLLAQDENGAYTLKKINGIPMVHQLDTQVRLEEVRLEEVRLEENNIEAYFSEIKDIFKKHFKTTATKITKKTAEQKIKMALKNKNGFEEIKKGWENYLNSKKGTDLKYIKHFDTFMNQELWKEYQQPVKADGVIDWSNL